ncbi:hypothetical protein HHI36_005932 [Cryptolaemus montrouzieri]|uniref:F-box domain-containing protein n=1 Tax=Cryptolaemus montrouzieri TaxID=559131 RepID=A0ABD2NVU4_9CUCU
MANIKDLPDEVLEFILSLISPYQDLHDCMAVSKRWRRCVHNVVKNRRRNLNRSISDFNVKWMSLTPSEVYPTISKRYSHSAAIHENAMYVFGGCTCSMTTFNDLWKFDLSKRQWIRPLATGTYPSPKACSSLVYHKNSLVLFGGWTYPPTYPLYQSWHLFNDLHVYDIGKNHWRAVGTALTPPPMAGHSVSIIDNWMIVFGGLAKPNNAIDCEKTNDIWKLNLNDWVWTKQEVEGTKKPQGRFGQTQVILDNSNIFIIGGSGGSNVSYGDAWVLNMSNDNAWKWTPVEIRGKPNKPVNIWSNPGCKVDNKIVVLNRVQTDTIFPLNSSRCPPEYREEAQLNVSARIDSASRQPDLDENVNGRRGSLRMPHRENNAAGPSYEGIGSASIVNSVARPGPSIAAFVDVEQNLRYSGVSLKDRTSFLKRHKEAERRAEWKGNKNNNSHFLGIYVLDLEHALDEKPYVTWLTPKNFNKGPEETILYTLVQGKSELIMFGGIQNDTKSLGQLNNQISNSLHFISARDHII